LGFRAFLTVLPYKVKEALQDDLWKRRSISCFESITKQIYGGFAASYEQLRSKIYGERHSISQDNRTGDEIADSLKRQFCKKEKIS
jgi:hypothetical protein